ncbi:MAG: phosphoribosyl-AMP cyclohydrolase [Planctomycetota bacterium]|jgi:phosphoribosyl-AMP cyclohydrolase|nr:phosphoribosyl-AMP cyclohydrolase [Planctomycetota bacterium]
MDWSFLDNLKYSADGLIPCITQDDETGEVLMLAYMNRDSLRETLEKKLCSYWSRSRQKYWVKGETSGHTQEVKAVFLDCDRDTLLIKIKQNGGACHTGYRSCFSWRVTESGALAEQGVKVFDSEKVYGSK